VINAGIFCTKPFTDFTTEDFNGLVSTNLMGFLCITQLTVKQMLKQRSGSVVSITAALADQPIAGINGSVPMITKGGLNSVIRSLAIEYAKERGGAPGRWRCSRWPLVAAEHFNLVPGR